MQSVWIHHHNPEGTFTPWSGVKPKVNYQTRIAHCDTDIIVNHNKPDAVVYDKVMRRITIIEVGLTSRERLTVREVEKKAK